MTHSNVYVSLLEQLVMQCTFLRGLVQKQHANIT